MTEDDFWFLMGVTNYGWFVTVGVRDIMHRTEISQNERHALLLKLNEISAKRIEKLENEIA